MIPCGRNDRLHSALDSISLGWMAHWDHMDGIDLFPKATVWIQKQEFAYYTGDAWQPGGRHGGIDPEDVKALVQRNTEGHLRLVDGDNVEILPGIHAYTGARHTVASQYIRVGGDPPFVLASDNCYLYRNLAEHKASGRAPPQYRSGEARDRTTSSRRLPSCRSHQRSDSTDPSCSARTCACTRYRSS